MTCFERYTGDQPPAFCRNFVIPLLPFLSDDNPSMMHKLTGALVSAFTLAAVMHGSTALAADNTLIAAASRGDLTAVRSLIAQRADVNATDVVGTTPLLNAVWAGEPAIVDALLTAGAKAAVANAFGMTPAYIAAEQGNATILRRLLDAGAEPNTTDGSGDTLLMA